MTSISQSLVAIRLKAASFQWKAQEKAISFLGRAEGATAIFGMVPQSVGNMAGFSAVRQQGGSSGQKGDKGGKRRGEGGRERHRSRKGRKKAKLSCWVLGVPRGASLSSCVFTDGGTAPQSPLSVCTISTSSTNSHRRAVEGERLVWFRLHPRLRNPVNAKGTVSTI